MFQTHRSALFPFQYDPDFELWDWVELGVNAPVFMLEITTETDDGNVTTHRMTSSIEVLRRHVQASGADLLKRVFLLSPGYVNGSNSFQLDVLEQVLTAPNHQLGVLFKLASGKTLQFSLTDRNIDESDFTVEVYANVATSPVFSSRRL